MEIPPDCRKMIVKYSKGLVLIKAAQPSRVANRQLPIVQGSALNIVRGMSFRLHASKIRNRGLQKANFRCVSARD